MAIYKKQKCKKGGGRETGTMISGFPMKILHGKVAIRNRATEAITGEKWH